jgi:hypothetical protein
MEEITNSQICDTCSMIPWAQYFQMAVEVYPDRFYPKLTIPYHPNLACKGELDINFGCIFCTPVWKACPDFGRDRGDRVVVESSGQNSPEIGSVLLRGQKLPIMLLFQRRVNDLGKSLHIVSTYRSFQYLFPSRYVLFVEGGFY